MEAITPGWKTTSRITEHFFFFYALYESETTHMGSIGVCFFFPKKGCYTAGDTPPGVRKRSLWIRWIVQSSFLRVLFFFFFLARDNRRALVTDYHSVIWCD